MAGLDKEQRRGAIGLGAVAVALICGLGALRGAPDWLFLPAVFGAIVALVALVGRGHRRSSGDGESGGGGVWFDGFGGDGGGDGGGGGGGD
ncbi:hypothetical protein [Maritimibacter dapengensis]|uniref:Uncharacterized protein n=1 Tax=Maritimibacter dapengensis TaxID=2836868 RepID=A0ABS6SZF2_9RHOB|nr:hypothetical protein [Maritimibacter dapengensis]MBV7377898.1 hypothetical protein [Maritimibacter dapengensis]